MTWPTSRFVSTSFEEYLERALYDPGAGFYEQGGGAGRRGDFLTSPELGPLFGSVVARALDDWWAELGRPDPYVVVEAGAGTGALARAVVAAEPACRSALRYVMVERSARLRPAGAHADLPAEPFTGVILANELLDNLAFRLVERTGGAWREVRVVQDGDRLVEALVPAAPELAAQADELAPAAPDGARVPLQRQAAAWLERALGLVKEGRVVVVDYCDSTPSMARRPWAEWLRTYRSHGRGGHPLERPGTQDITCEVAVDQLTRVRPPTTDRSQAEFLAAHGIDVLVDEARARWHARAHIGDLDALRARSLLSESAALTDPTGLGAFRVLEWRTA